MSNASEILNKVRDLEKRHQELIDELLHGDELAVGSFVRSKRPCGNPRCKQCQSGPSHEQVVFSYTNEDGARTSRFVRRTEVERVESAWIRYEDFPRCLADLKRVGSEMLRLCRELMVERALDPKSSEA